MSSKYTIEQDMKELSTMGDNLAQYIPGDELYMGVGGGFFGSNMPKLTLGAFLMRLRRLNQLRDSLSPVQQAELDKAMTQHDQVRKEWTVHYEKKLTWEAQSRLKAMEEFFRECRENMKTCANAYSPEASRRTIVQELLIAMEKYGVNTHQVITQAHQTDAELRRWITAGDFIWSDELQPIYPRDTFWWLYGHPEAE